MCSRNTTKAPNDTKIMFCCRHLLSHTPVTSSPEWYTNMCTLPLTPLQDTLIHHCQVSNGYSISLVLNGSKINVGHAQYHSIQGI